MGGFRGILNWIHRDKDAICIGLEVISASIQEWHSDIVFKFAPWEAKGMKVDSEEEIISIIICAEDSTKQSFAEQSLTLLTDLVNNHKSKHLNGLDIGKIKDIINSLTDFKEETYKTKQKFMDSVQKGQLFSIEQIKDWKHHLNDDRRVINETVSSLKRDMGCQHISKKKIEEILKG